MYLNFIFFMYVNGKAQKQDDQSNECRKGQKQMHFCDVNTKTELKKSENYREHLNNGLK